MVDFTTGDTPLELARKAKEEETRQLMGFGETRESRQEMTEMQEIQNIFNTYKRTGSTLLQEGKITSEQYYNNTRRAGIKLGVIGADEYPDNLPTWLKPTLEIGGAVIGGIIPYIGGPAGLGVKVAAESIGSGLGAASGTSLYGIIQDIAAPDGMPTSSFGDVTKEAATEGAIVTGLTAGVLKGLPAIGRLASDAGKISPKTTARLKGLGKAGRDAIVNNTGVIKMKQLASGYMIKEQNIANDLLQDLRNQGIEPSYNMLIQNETIRSLIQALARTPILGKPERDSYELIKKDIFKRITEGVKPGTNTTIEESLGAFSNSFIVKNGQVVLKSGIKDKSLRELTLVSGFMREQRARNDGIQASYVNMKNALLADREFGSGKLDFNQTRQWWNNVNDIKSGERIALPFMNGKQQSVSEVLGNTNTGLYFNLLFRPDRLADKPLETTGLFSQTRAKDILDNLKYKSTQNIKGFNISSDYLIPTLRLGSKLTERQTDEVTKYIAAWKKDPDLAFATAGITNKEKFLKDVEFKFRSGSDSLKKQDLKLDRLKKYDIDELNKAALGKQLGANATAKEILESKDIGAIGEKFLSLPKPEQLLVAQKALLDDLNAMKYFEKTNGDNAKFIVLGGKLDQGRRLINADIKIASGSRVNNLIDDANKKYIDNNDLLDRSAPLLQGFRAIASTEQKETLLRMDNMFGGKLRKLDREGNVIPFNHLTDDGVFDKELGRIVYKTKLNKSDEPVLLSTEQQLRVPGVSQAELYSRGAMKDGQAPDADVIKKMFTEGDERSIKAFRKLVGKGTFRKFAQDEIDFALNNSLVKYINGTTDDGINTFWKSFGIGKREGSKEIQARMKTMINEADLAFNYGELEAFGHMLQYLNGAPALNQFIQRSMMLRFSQGIGPGAIAGLLGGGGGFAAAGAVGSLAGLGAMYMFNTMMASRIYGKDVKGAIKNYIKAVTAGNTDKAKEIAGGVFEKGDATMKPYYGIMEKVSQDMGLRQIPTQTAINLGVTSNFE